MVQRYLIVYFIVMVVCAMLISIGGNDLLTNFSVSLTCINNVAPRLTKMIGPYESIVELSIFSKLELSFEMIASRVEVFPLFILSKNLVKKIILILKGCF